jgi:hypothetical protein
MQTIPPVQSSETNIQTLFRDRRESLANNLIIRDVLPCQEYLPIGNTRVREEHEALGSISGARRHGFNPPPRRTVGEMWAACWMIWPRREKDRHH